VGMLAELETLQGLEGREGAAKKAITTKEGLEAFERALNSNLAQVIVSPENLEHLLKESEAVFGPTRYLSRVHSAERAFRPPGSPQDGAGQPTDIEAALIGMSSSVFGLERIGIHDNFLDMGGNSLLAMQIVSRIRSLYQIDFTLMELFEGPTIAQMSSVIQTRMRKAVA
jgi:aryl carrier-like protein